MPGESYSPAGFCQCAELSGAARPFALRTLRLRALCRPEVPNRRKTLRSDIVSWYELGGTHGRVVFDSEKHMLKWAVSGNLLISTNALHLQADPIAYSVADTGTVIATDLDARLRYALDPEGSTLGNLAPRGAGLGTTIGVTYFKPFIVAALIVTEAMTG